MNLDLPFDMTTPVCTVCQQPAQLVDGTRVYPHRPDLAHLQFWYCDNNHAAAYVGCHKNTTQPLGTLATAELRQLRSDAHAVFDKLWKEQHMTRTSAYNELSRLMRLSSGDTHIAMFDAQQCRTVIEIADYLYRKIRQQTIDNAN